ncbi:hypothetical protein X777_16914 [Ooceraea biroi]|uniref:Uncharacterized protein n=1 Tax=Ooceraea biroi TaxID=2015173 RepID=A0A026WSD0_OOCBI|nr:hypothetical protein X777_16914 [Ooceraea biroi]
MRRAWGFPWSPPTAGRETVAEPLTTRARVPAFPSGGARNRNRNVKSSVSDQRRVTNGRRRSSMISNATDEMLGLNGNDDDRTPPPPPAPQRSAGFRALMRNAGNGGEAIRRVSVLSLQFSHLTARGRRALQSAVRLPRGRAKGPSPPSMDFPYHAPTSVPGCGSRAAVGTRWSTGGTSGKIAANSGGPEWWGESAG